MKGLRSLQSKLKKSVNGRGTSRLLPFGLLIASGIFLVTLFRGKMGILKNLNSQDQEILNILSINGYEGLPWIAVSRYETGNYTSNLYDNYNNLFGMRYPLIRDTTSYGSTPSGFAKYYTTEDSIKDLILYMQEFNYPKRFNSFYDQISFMKDKGYYGESLDYYYSGAKTVYDKLT